MDEIAIKLNIKEPSDWGKVTVQKVFELGGTTLLKNYHRGSLFLCLQSVYKEIKWNKEWFSRVSFGDGKSYWKSVDNQKRFIEKVAKELEIKTTSDWGNIPVEHLLKLGGSFIKRYYNNSIYKCLLSLYKDIEWKREWFYNVPKHSNAYWRSLENRKQFMDKIALELNIKYPKEWGKVTSKQFHALGGGSLVSNYYKNSLFACLQSVYKNVEWKREWFPKMRRYPTSYWMNEKNQIEFLDKLAIEYNLYFISDWMRVSLSLIRKQGGQGLLLLYGNSLMKAIATLYNHPYLWENHKYFKLSVSQQRFSSFVLQ